MVTTVDNPPSHVSGSIAAALESLGRAVNEQTPEHEAESNRRMADITECVQAQRHGGGDRENRAAKMTEAVNGAVELARTEGLDAGAVRRRACEVIATHVLAHYGLKPTNTHTQLLVETALRYGPSAVQDAACDFLSEPHDPSVRNPIAVVANRTKRSFEMRAAR